MSGPLSRRDFLKLSGAMCLASNLPSLFLQPTRAASEDLPNILIIVFDAWSARNIELYGYGRPTTPNLNRLAERATVFHNHFAGGSYTIPGTSSILTGTYPTSHRAFILNQGIAPFFEKNNLFTNFDQYYRYSYTHNTTAFTILDQFQDSFENLKPPRELFVGGGNLFTDRIFANDQDIASISWEQAMVKSGRKGTYSLLLTHLNRVINDYRISYLSGEYPRGITQISSDRLFLLDEAIDWTIQEPPGLPEPFLGYVHYLPPHLPYLTRSEFIDRFKDDGYHSIKKPEHIFSMGTSFPEQEEKRRFYDEFVLFADSEFGRLFDQLEQEGVLDNTILVLTSDHGEMFERGIDQHFTESLHLPVIQVPLLIFEPGQTTRKDIFSPTSNVDLMPTLLHLAGQPIPDWVDGQILPPFNPLGDDPSRSVYAADAKYFEEQYGEINPGSFMIIKEGYKLTYYIGYETLDNAKPLVELFDLENDPEELEDLSNSHKDIADDLLEELLAMVDEGNRKSMDYR
jgi:arylsulfatase A-like enzyme